MNRYEGWLKSLNVIYVGDPRAPQVGWLSAAGARVIRAERGEEARAATTDDASAIEIAVIDADWPGVGWIGLARDLPRSCGLIVISDRSDSDLLEAIAAARADFVSRSATEADFVFRLKSATKLAVPSMRRLVPPGIAEMSQYLPLIL